MRSRGLLMLALLLLGAQTASAANKYLRVGATGSNNGTDWTNAYSSMGSVSFSGMGAGDTLFVAAGTYNGSMTVNVSGASGNPLSIKRATVADHGTVTGWNNAYNGQVILDGNANGAGVINLAGNFLTFDGVTKYGIWIRNAMYGFRAGSAVNNITLRYLEIGDPGIWHMGEDGVQGEGSNLLVEYCYIHDNDSAVTHGDGVQWYEGNNIIMRYNVFKNNGQIVMMTETAFGYNQYVNDFYFYYNVVYNRSGGHYQGLSKKLCPQSGFGWFIYNNTFDLDRPTTAGAWQDEIFGGDGTCTRMNFKNNVVINSRVFSINGTTHNYNAYDTSAPLQNLNGDNCNGSCPETEANWVTAASLGLTSVTGDDANPDYHVVAGSPLIGAGTNVGLTQDFDGKTVPSTPTIGAFEQGTTMVLNPPTNLHVVP